jgi:hypothetical protein
MRCNSFIFLLINACRQSMVDLMKNTQADFCLSCEEDMHSQ